MTSVPFDLNVTITNENGRQEKYGAVEFRFTTKAARALERAAGSGISWLMMRGQSVEALVLLVCYGLQWQHQKMTEAKAVDLIDAYIEAGGNTRAISEAASKALQLSGVYGRNDDEARADPLAPTPASAETTAGASVTG